MPLQKDSLIRVESALHAPFVLAHIAQMDDVAVFAYSCEGTISWHRHLDYDELFLVYRGSMVLETQQGSLMLGPWDLAVAPKGVGHRSGSVQPTTVLLMQVNVLPDRRNGDRRPFAISGSEIERISLPLEAHHLRDHFVPKVLATAGGVELRLMLCKGIGPEWQAAGPQWLLVQSGQVDLEVEGETLSLAEGEFVAIPAGAAHRLTAAVAATIITLSRRVDEPLNH